MPPKKSSSAPPSAPPSGLFRRSKELLSLAAKVGQKELSSKISKFASNNPALTHSVNKLQTQLSQAQLLVESLSHLRGAAMKAGQMLSIEAADYLPPEVIKILTKLHDSSETMPYQNVEEILKAELSPESLSKIENISTLPIASASIGQVHRARYQNHDIALKIQFPGVDKSLRSDVVLLKNIAKAFVTIKGKNISLDELFEEFILILEQEVDYLKESENMIRYKNMLAQDPRFVIPAAFEELTSARVLAMSYETGLRPSDWLDTNPSSEEREFFAKAFLDLYVAEFYKFGFVQTDPNFGNFLIRPDQKTLVLLDFGAMKSFDPSFIESYRGLLKTIVNGSDQEIYAYTVAMGILDSRESKECQAAFADMLRLSVAPFDAQYKTFDFGSSHYSKEMNQKSMNFTRLIQFSPPPKDILFLHRKLSGLFRLIQSMKVKIPLQDYWENFVSV